jgi:hypothetical protein
MNHTPGPWVARIKERGAEVRTNSEAEVYLGYFAHSNTTSAADFYSTTNEECIANARLIAAAPEMLDALRLVREVYEYAKDSDNNENWVEFNNMNTAAVTAINAVLAKLEERNQ